MQPDKTRRRGSGAKYLVLGLTLCIVPAALGHAVLLESTPAPGAKVSGDRSPVRLRFNLSVDGKRSRLILVQPDRTTRVIVLDSQPSPAVLLGILDHLTPGEHRIRWQVLANDGHISRGAVAFEVVATSPQP
jgi:methionine-rich copper-binding protein CopC